MMRISCVLLLYTALPQVSTGLFIGKGWVWKPPSQTRISYSKLLSKISSILYKGSIETTTITHRTFTPQSTQSDV